MQTPPLAQPFSKGKIGYIVALAGSAVATLSFLALPFVSVIILGSFSLLQLAQLAGSYGASSTSLFQNVGIMWVSLVIAIVGCVIALVCIIQTDSRALGGAIGLIVLGVIDTGIFLYMISQVSTTYTSAAIGAWLCLLGMIATAIGGIVAIAGRPPTGVTHV